MKIKSCSNSKSQCDYITFKKNYLNCFVGGEKKKRTHNFQYFAVASERHFSVNFLYQAPTDHKLLLLILT